MGADSKVLVLSAIQGASLTWVYGHISFSLLLLPTQIQPQHQEEDVKVIQSQIKGILW